MRHILASDRQAGDVEVQLLTAAGWRPKRFAELDAARRAVNAAAYMQEPRTQKFDEQTQSCTWLMGPGRLRRAVNADACILKLTHTET